MRLVDLNADMGEGFGPWTMGSDRELAALVTSASLACGFHAGDPSVMARTVDLCLEQGVSVGAHPGYPDLQGFGRRDLEPGPNEITITVTDSGGLTDTLSFVIERRLRFYETDLFLPSAAAAALP